MHSFMLQVRAATEAAQAREAEVPLEQLRERCRQAPAVRDFRAALLPDLHGVRVVAGLSGAEGERMAGSSPAGVDPSLPLFAQFFQAGGAAALAVAAGSTPESREQLAQVAALADIPILAAGLFATPYQLQEARAHGVDAVTLDARLEPLVLESLIDRCHSLAMEPVLVVRDVAEAQFAANLGARTLLMDVRGDSQPGVARAERITEMCQPLPSSALAMAYGGVRTARNVLEYARCGADAVLVHDAAHRAFDPQQFIALLVAAGSHPSLSGPLPPSPTTHLPGSQ